MPGDGVLLEPGFVTRLNRMALLSIVVPTLNEAQGIAAALEPIQALRHAGAEVIVVDGGSSDGTPDRATPWVDRLLVAPRGRASQMNVGALAAQGDILLFLHADTRLPEGAAGLISTALAAGRTWGRFDVVIEGHSRWFPLIAALMNWRSRLTGIATGDQAMFVTRAAFWAIGGFPEIPLMEDIALSSSLRRVSSPVCFRQRVNVSGRRWESMGVWRTVRLMWTLRLRYFFGADPRELAAAYGYIPRTSHER